MQIAIPEVNETLSKLMAVECEFDGRAQTISKWVMEHRNKITENHNLLTARAPENDIKILNIFLRDLLVRAIKGEMGLRVYEELIATIKDKADLHATNYRMILKKSKYRWGVDDGTRVISAVVSCVKSDLRWDWNSYIAEAEKQKENNYQDDPILCIKNISYKLRDLALSNFSPHYAAFDLHVTRVLTRIGWLNYGFPLVGNNDLEMGNNPGNDKNYLFLHSLFVLLSNITEGKYTPVDLDRIFWHLGKSKCGAKTQCFGYPIKEECLTGKYRTRNN